jgi:hypothetical protein
MINDSAIGGSAILLLEVHPQRISILIIDIKYCILFHSSGILGLVGTIIMSSVGDFRLKSSGDSIIFTQVYYNNNLPFTEFRFLSLL